jgi:hypothetical protein
LLAQPARLLGRRARNAFAFRLGFPSGLRAHGLNLRVESGQTRFDFFQLSQRGPALFLRAHQLAPDRVAPRHQRRPNRTTQKENERADEQQQVEKLPDLPTRIVVPRRFAAGQREN